MTAIFISSINELAKTESLPRQLLDFRQKFGAPGIIPAALVRLKTPNAGLYDEIQSLFYGTANGALWPELPVLIHEIMKGVVKVDAAVEKSGLMASGERLKALKHDLLQVMGAPEPSEVQVDLSGRSRSPLAADVTSKSSQSPTIIAEATEFLQVQWGQLSELQSAVDVLIREGSSLNVVAMKTRLDFVIKHASLVEWDSAIAQFSALRLDLERKRSALEDDYETRRQSHEEFLRSHGDVWLAERSKAALELEWVNHNRQSVPTLQPPLASNEDSPFGWLVNPVLVQMPRPDESKLQEIIRHSTIAVKGSEVFFPNINEVNRQLLNFAHSFRCDLKDLGFGDMLLQGGDMPLQGSDSLVKVLQYRAMQTTVAKELTAVWKDIEDCLPECQACEKLDRSLVATRYNLSMMASGLSTLQSALVVDFEKSSEEFLSETADLYSNIYAGEAEEVALNFEAWEKKFTELPTRLDGITALPKQAEGQIANDALAGVLNALDFNVQATRVLGSISDFLKRAAEGAKGLQ